MKTLFAFALLLAAGLTAAEAPAPLLPEYQALYATATGGGEALVYRMNADVIAARQDAAELRRQMEALNAERVTLHAQVAALTAERDAAHQARDAALARLARIRAEFE